VRGDPAAKPRIEEKNSSGAFAMKPLNGQNMVLFSKIMGLRSG
jgi:hypothetical protein